MILDEFNKPLYLIGCVNEIGKRQKADNISGLLREPCLEEYVQHYYAQVETVNLKNCRYVYVN